MYKLPINPGYYFVKTVGGMKIRSKLRKIENDIFTTSSDKIIYNDERYLIGEGDINLSMNKTDNSNLRVLLLDVEAKFLDKDKSFHLFLTTPPLLYDKQKDALEKYMLGEFDIIYNGKPKKITNEKVTVLPETFMAYISNCCNPYYEDKVVIVIDIGGKTTNIMKFEDGAYDDKAIICMPSGMYKMSLDIRSKLLANYYITLSESDLYYVQLNHHLNDDNFKDITYALDDVTGTVYNEHIENIVEHMHSAGWDIGNAYFLITGGGGKQIFSNIKKRFSNSVLGKDPLFDNLNGLQYLAEHEEMFL